MRAAARYSSGLLAASHIDTPATRAGTRPGTAARVRDGRSHRGDTRIRREDVYEKTAEGWRIKPRKYVRTLPAD